MVFLLQAEGSYNRISSRGEVCLVKCPAQINPALLLIQTCRAPAESPGGNSCVSSPAADTEGFFGDVGQQQQGIVPEARVTKAGLTQTFFVCLFCAFLHKGAPRRKFCPLFGDVEIASKAATNTRHRNEMPHLSLIWQNLHHSCASRVTSQAVFSKLLICCACSIVIVACCPRSFQQMLIQSD